MQDDVVETTFHVRYAETDAMGIVHHASYIVWFEEGRSAWGRVKGVPYNDFEASGVFLALAELHARYAVPARYGMRVTIRTHLVEYRSRALRFAYQVVNTGDGVVLATGASKHICIDEQGKPVRLPDVWIDKLKVE